MKFLILCSLIALAMCMPTEDDHSHHHTRHDGPESFMPLGTSVHHAKKVSGSASGFGQGGGAEACAATCLSDMNSQILSDSSLADYFTKQSQPYRFDDRFNPNKLRPYCSKLRTTVDCVQPCSGGTMKEIANAALILPRYMCIDSKMLQHAQCIQKVNKEQKSRCDNKCSSQKSSLQRSLGRQPATMGDIQNLLRGTCEYMDCDSECDYGKIKQECGAEAGKIYLTYYKKSLDSAKALFEAMGVQVSLPSQCNSVGVADD